MHVLRGGAGREITETLARELHVDFKVAEQYKRIYGIRETQRGFRSLVTGLSKLSEEALPGVLYAILRPVLDSLITEARPLVPVCNRKAARNSRGGACGGGRPASMNGPLYLIGGGARLQGLREVLEMRLNIPVSTPQPQAVAGLCPFSPGNAQSRSAAADGVKAAGTAVSDRPPSSGVPAGAVSGAGRLRRTGSGPGGA